MGGQRASSEYVTIEDFCAMAIWFGTTPMQIAAEWYALPEKDRQELFALFSAQVY